MTNDTKINVILDATSLDTFLTCPAKYSFRFINNKVPELKPTALDRGTLGHIGFEYYYKALQNKDDFDHAVQVGVDNLRFTLASDESDLDPEEGAAVITAFTESCSKWRHLDEQLEIIEVEKSFSRVLYEDKYCRIIYIGKIDLLVNHPVGFPFLPDTKFIPYDHKTYSRDSELLRTANQFSGYAWATDSSYLIVNRVGLQKSLKPDVKHKRIPLSYDPLFLDEWKDNTVTILKHFIECSLDNNWPRYTTSCMAYNRKCEYHEICNSSGQEAKTCKLSMMRSCEPWDVSASLGNNK